jgi:transposase InsO family protein
VQANLALDARVAAIHRASGRSYGRERIHLQMHDEGMPVGRERIRKSLERQGLRPVYRRPYRVTTDSDHDTPLSPNLLERRFDGWSVNQAWVADITCVATDEGWLYLAAVMDLASRRIVGWSMSERIQAELVCEALKSAYWRRKPGPGLIMHTDRGGQYASTRYRGLVRDYRMKASMTGKGNCWDNAAMESFFKTLKVERVYQVRYSTRAQAQLDIVDWIEGFYDRRRLHFSTGYRTPVAVEDSTVAA